MKILIRDLRFSNNTLLLRFVLDSTTGCIGFSYSGVFGYQPSDMIDDVYL